MFIFSHFNTPINAGRAIKTKEGAMAWSYYAFTNKELSQGKAETIFIPASREYMYLSSSGVREIAINQGDISAYVDKGLEEKIKLRAKELVK